MVRKTLITGLVFAGLLFFGMTGKASADAAALFEQAGTYRSTGWSQQARQLYNTIVQQYPATDSALKAQAEVIILDIPEKQDSQIQAAVGTLISTYSQEPNLPAVLCNIAAGYGWSEKFEQTNSLYQQVIQQWPDSSAVLKAQLGISRTNIVSLVKAGDYTTAVAETDKMLQDFSGHPYLPAALYHIARRYQWSRQYERADSIYQQIIQRFPDSDEADRARLEDATTKAMTLIKANDYTAAEAEIDKLMQDFSGHLGLATVVHSLASEYEAQAKYEMARNLHQQIIQQWPDHSYVERAQFDFSKTTVLSLIQSGDYTASEAELGKFTTDFGQHTLFTKAIFAIGEQYYRRGRVKKSQGQDGESRDYFQKVVTMWETRTSKLPGSAVSPDECCWTGDSYRELGEYEKSIECFQKVISDHPEYKFAWHAIFSIGRNYESLEESGLISKTEAEVKIRAVYQQLLDSYPDCTATTYAREWMTLHNSN